MNYSEQLNKISSHGLRRELRAIQPLPNGYCIYKGQKMVNLSSNDYLGLATDENLKKEFNELLMQNTDWMQFGSSSSRLLTGNTGLYDKTEALIKNWYGAESALFFNSGYHANTGILAALSDKGDLILSDKLCHASIIDGIRLSNADHIRYKHSDVNHIESILEKKRTNYNRVFIVSESIFSMDGDEADLRKLVELKQKYDAILYVDEAHAVGAVGNNGLGLCEVQNVVHDIDILVGTMGKAMASVGAYAVFGEQLRQMLINKARTLIFTTALPNINMAWTAFVIEKMPYFVEQRQKLAQLSKSAKQNINIENSFQGFIIPHIVGENEVAVKLSEHLQKQGFLVFPIRPPTVPQGTARLRISLTANIKKSSLNDFFKILKQ